MKAVSRILDIRFRIILSSIIGVIVFIIVGLGVEILFGTFLAGVVAALIATYKTDVSGFTAWMATAIIATILQTVLLMSGLLVPKEVAGFQYSLLVVTIVDAAITFVICAIGGLLGNSIGRRYLNGK
jgi:hypothetical protein